ncbi:MAG: histidinol-phosphate transaminase [Alphaproteobacteria bacterium]
MSPLAPRPGILEIKPYKGGKSRLEEAPNAIKLSSNEGALGPSPKAMDAYRGLAPDLHRYPDGACTDLRAAIGNRFKLDPARIVCGAGSDELLALLARAYAGPGDEVLRSAHGFAMYAIIANGVGARPVAAPETDLTADVDALLDHVTTRTRIVFLANPNNPTGSYVDEAALRRLRAGLPDNVLLVIDAAYAEYVGRNDYIPGDSLVDAHDNVVMTRTFSKLFALGGLRIGWAYCPEAIADVLNRVRPPFNVTAPAQVAGVAAVEDIAHTDAARTHNDEWLPWLAGKMTECGLHAYPSVANFLLVRYPDAPGRDAAAAERFFNERGIIPRGVADYGLPDCLRITIGRDDENRAVAEAMAAFMSGHDA